MLQSDGREDTHAYTELVDVLLRDGANPIADIHELWRRLSPAFDLNPMPGDRRESKTWLTEDSGVVDSRSLLMEGAPYFRLGAKQAATIWNEVARAVDSWRSVAKG